MEGASNGGMLYHEVQESKLCAVHCVNTVLQGPFFSEFDLAALASDLDRKVEFQVELPKMNLDLAKSHFQQKTCGYVQKPPPTLSHAASPPFISQVLHENLPLLLHLCLCLLLHRHHSPRSPCSSLKVFREGFNA